MLPWVGLFNRVIAEHHCAISLLGPFAARSSLSEHLLPGVTWPTTTTFIINNLQGLYFLQPARIVLSFNMAKPAQTSHANINSTVCNAACIALYLCCYIYCIIGCIPNHDLDSLHVSFSQRNTHIQWTIGFSFRCSLNFHRPGSTSMPQPRSYSVRWWYWSRWPVSWSLVSPLIFVIKHLIIVFFVLHLLMWEW